MGNMIKIDGKPIGLFGFELAVSKVKALSEKKNLTPKEAAKELFETLKKKNYIPDAKKNAYLKAFEDYFQGSKDTNAVKIIRILGPGCVGCNKLESVVMEVLSENNIAADIFHVTDKDEILRFGVTKTPALIIDEKVVSAGKIPSKAQIQKFIMD